MLRLPICGERSGHQFQWKSIVIQENYLCTQVLHGFQYEKHDQTIYI